MDTYQAVYDAVRSKLGNGDIGSAVTDAVRSAFDISFTVPAIAQDFYVTLAEHRRPSVLYKPKIYIDGDKWCALYGDNLHDGLAGFGSTVEEAMQDFDKNWSTYKLYTGKSNA